ncbi:uncharacterized protein LOC124493286 [Dermatophagoides farinae]|uniref:SAP domain-containing protein n=1 Tax=Dermatophagoides farinae TaxID=6954 RepID=A0A922HI97_DERFA|nr:hypothetical protein DERF_014492 [Dermatophagoides farinae]
MDFSSLTQLKVADLKQQLRLRGLAITGNKTDLIQRLQQSLMKDSGLVNVASTDLNQVTTPLSSSTLTQQQQQSHHQTNVSKSISNQHNNEIDEDAILGGDDDDDVVDDVDDDETSNSELIDKIPNEDLLLSDNQTSSTVANTSIINESKQKSNTMIKQSSSTPAAAAATTTKNPIAVAAKPTTSIPSLKQMATKISSAPLTSEERKRLRQLKFADPKIVNRVERFGVQDSSVKKLIEPTDEGKLLKRIHRFGEVVSNKAKTLNERELLERRKQRFSGNVATTTAADVSSNKIFINSNVPENIQKRQDRFGVVEKPSKPLHMFNNVGGGGGGNNNFKRRRFAY